MRLRFAERVSAAELERLRLVARLAAQLGTPAWLVGGSVRDAWLGHASLDLDVTVEGDPLPLAQGLAEALGGKLTHHERFGTTVIEAGEYHLDVATARRETYPCPGALPAVEPASLDEDLRRRDFTVNAMALRLDADLDTVYDPLDGCGDLDARIIRGLHEATFRDDPTRIIRAARYAARLGCALAAQTESWLRSAIGDGALATVTGTRLWQELRRLLWEETAPDGLALLEGWQALPALGLCPPRAGELRELYASVASHKKAPLTESGGVASCATGPADLYRGKSAGPVAHDATPPDSTVRELLGHDTRDGRQAVPASDDERALAALGLLAVEAEALAESFGLSAEERRAVVAAARLAADPPPCVFAASPKSSTLYEALLGLPWPALLALWTRHPGSRSALQTYGALVGVRSDINGQDLQRLGFAPSAGFAVALQAALRVKLDDHANQDEQLAVAREALVQWQTQRGL